MQYNPNRNKVVVTVEGGIVQSIEGGPDGLTVEVWDFDVNSEDLESELETNEQAEQFRLYTSTNQPGANLERIINRNKNVRT